MKVVLHGLWLVWRVVRGLCILAFTATTPAIAAATALALLVFVLLPGTTPEQRPVTPALPITVLAADGTPLAQLRGYDLVLPVQPDDVSAVVVDALVSAEDRRFFEHDGIDMAGIARAARTNLEADGVRQGGSTITQQLVKMRYLDDSLSMDRKLREAIVAQQLEQSMTKDEILHAYLEAAYFGSGATGLVAASIRYFGVEPADLNVSQAAMLVGMLPSPTAYSPHTDLAAAEAARLRTIDAMEQNGVLDPVAAADAAAQVLVLVDAAGVPVTEVAGPYTAVYPIPTSDLGPFPAIASMVSSHVAARFGDDAARRGLTVTTTIDPRTQLLAQIAVDKAVAQAADPTVAAALAAVEPSTGFVRALADTNDFAVSQVNLATGGETGFQVGSSAKPFVLIAALEAGLTPSTTVDASASWTAPTGEVVRNFGGGAGGRISLRAAVEQSWNTPFVRLADELGPDRVAEVARRLGVTSWGEGRSYGPSVALGAYETSPLEMASAFATLANNGVRQDPTVILRITDGAGRVLEDNTLRPGTQVLDPVVAANVTDVLTGVVTSGTGTAARVAGRPVAAKTGTAEQFTAAWFVGYTPQLSAAVWLGHADGVRPLGRIGAVGEVTGGSVPARAWVDFMVPALESSPVVGFAPATPLRNAGPPPGREEPPAPPEPQFDPAPQVTGVPPAQTPTPTPR